MKKFITQRCLRAGLAASLGLLFLGTAPAGAGMCALDQVPAATLLLPYFEVDYQQQGGLTTVVRLQNATAEPALIHLTLWTEWSQPTLDFDTFFTGYDVVTFNMRDMFAAGNIHITADRQSDPNDFISPHGSFPEWDASFDGCNFFFPFFVNPVIRANNLVRIQNGHTGLPIASLGSNRCLGPSHGDNIARGYITFDDVRSCSTAFPFDVGYFVDSGVGITTDRNHVFGDWQILDPSRGIAYGGPLVAIEADPLFAAASTPTGYTFWGTVAAGGGDNREPLAAVWDFRFAAGADAADPFTATDLLVWRDTTSNDHPNNGFDCTAGPSFAPMQEKQVFCFDEQENVIELCGGAGGVACFPLATQRVAFDAGALSLPFSRGFCRLDLDNPNDAPAGDRDFPPTGATVQQSHVAVVRHGASGLGAASPATAVRHTCSPPAALGDGF